MRKIERWMLEILAKGDHVKRMKGNTEDIVGPEFSEVKLHGNTIAVITQDQVRLHLCDWNTPTTRSRLNAICEGYFGERPVRSKQFVPFFGELEFLGVIVICKNKPFEKGSFRKSTTYSIYP